MAGFLWGDFVLFVTATIALHIIVDFHLQGCLADLKQKKWWLDNVFAKGFDHKYEKDYLAALIIHSLEWSIFVHIPVLFMTYHFTGSGSIISLILFFSILLHAGIHAFIDDLKCNKLKINLVQDQILHLGQLVLIIATYMGALLIV